MNMTVKEIRERAGLTPRELSDQYHIPLQTIRQWESNPGSSSFRKAPEYVIYMLGRLVELDSKRSSADQGSEIMDLLKYLKEQKRTGISGQLYELTQIEMAYNSNRIEGSTLTLMQAQLLYTENKTSGNTDLNDLTEMKNHFKLFDYMLDTAEDPLSHELIKEYHRILKEGTDQAKLSWFAVGDYKLADNVIGASVMTTPVKEVYPSMDSLIKQYNSKPAKTFEDIVDFHARFEKIHPFQDGNGRIGRIILFKECLANNITPIVVLDRQKVSYINGLNDYYEHPKKLMRTMEKFQQQYEKQVDKYMTFYDRAEEEYEI